MKIIFRIKKISHLLSCAVIPLILYSSCSDEAAVNNNNNQGTSGPTPTQIGTPTGVPVTSTIDASGGSIMSADSSFELIIPAGALGSNTDISVQPVENFCFNSDGDAIRLTPDGQQFSQPVTIKFHYSQEVLESTYDILMGIARQDPSGYWHYFNNVSNDTINRVISITLDQFGYPADNNSGGGDVSFFDLAHLEPRSKIVRTSQSVNMTVTYVAAPEDGKGDRLEYLPHPIHAWYVNGVVNGNNTLGIIQNISGQTSIYKSPAQIPSPDVVSVQALVNVGTNYRGQVISQFLLQSSIKIRPDNLVYDLKIDMVWHDYLYGIVQYHCTYFDGVDMVVSITGTYHDVSVTNIVNRMPSVVPPSGTYPNGQGSITWVPVAGDSGHVHISSISGYILPVDLMSLVITHTNTHYGKFHFIPPKGEPYDIGGGQIAGVPASLELLANGTTQVYTDPNWGITATLTPRP